MQFKTYCAIMRQKREKGEYQKVICLEPILMGQENNSSLSSRWVYKCMVSGTDNQPKEKPILDDPLPPTILAQLMEIAATKQADKKGRLMTTMRKRKGEYPFVRFSRRFLNEIWKQGGEANIHFMHLNKMLDLKPDDEERGTVLKSKKLLHQHGLIHGGWQRFIRRGACSSRYTLTKWAKDEFAQCRGREAAAGYAF